MKPGGGRSSAAGTRSAAAACQRRFNESGAYCRLEGQATGWGRRFVRAAAINVVVAYDVVLIENTPPSDQIPVALGLAPRREMCLLLAADFNIVANLGN